LLVLSGLNRDPTETGRDVEISVEWADGLTPSIEESWIEHVIRTAVVTAKPELGSDPEAEVAVLLADDETLHALNREFRQKDAPTDVLSFEGDADPEEVQLPGAPWHLGDIAISLERVERQAEEYGHSMERELAYLLTHGTLHLLRYDHEDEESRRLMREVEEAAMSVLGLPRP
jgi:probable rRNA maturation factor